MRLILYMLAPVSAAPVPEFPRNGELTAVFFASALSLFPFLGLLELVKASIVTLGISSNFAG